MTPDTEASAPPPEDDDGLEWLREIRRQMAAECNYDPYEMGRRLRERERVSGRQYYRTERVLVPVKDETQGVHRESATEDAESSCVLREDPPSR